METIEREDRSSEPSVDRQTGALSESDQIRQARPSRGDTEDVSSDAPAKGRRRRRRRRGGKRPEGTVVAGRSDTDETLSSEDADEGALSFDEGVEEPSATITDGEEAEGSETEEKRPRRRRRRRGGGKKKRLDRETAESGETAKAGSLSDLSMNGDEEEDEAATAGIDERQARQSDAEADDDIDEDDDEESKELKGHRGIPSWDEAIGYIIGANMDSRAKNPHSSSAAPRSRGGRGGGGGHRGRGRTSGS